MTIDIETVDDADPQEDNSRSALCEGIADGLATLSEAAESPSGVEPTPYPFTAADVDFETGGWISRLASVQGWLNFDSDLPESSPEAFLVALVQGLGLTEDEGVDS